MPMEADGGARLAVVAGDVLALRGAGLAAAETWALLCQAAQALQDLFLSNGGVVGGSGMGPVVTPYTLELTPRGRVTLQLAPPETARAYLPPEYRPGRMYSDTDSEKMWMYSLGRALLDTTPRGAALTGTVSVSPSSALQSVLAAMTDPDPHRRASLMNLLDVISEYCRTRLQTKPFSHIVMDMYREVIRSPQYSARRRAAVQPPEAIPVPSQHRHHHPQHQQQSQHPPTLFSKHHVKGALFKAQSRNSRSHPNLLSLSGREDLFGAQKPEFQSQLNIQTSSGTVHHVRTNSQPENTERTPGPQQARSSSNNLLMLASNQNLPNSGNIYSDPIYSLPVKPFLSSQDVRVNGLTANSHAQKGDIYAQPWRNNRRNGAPSHNKVVHFTHCSNGQVVNRNEDIYSQSVKKSQSNQSLHRRQSSIPQLPGRNEETDRKHSTSQPNVSNQLRIYSGYSEENEGAIYGTQILHSAYQQRVSEENGKRQQGTVSSAIMPLPRGPVPPKPPRIITTLKRAAPASGSDVESGPPVKPPRCTIKNGPRARRGKAVQRAPSRLYRAIGGPSRSFSKTQCVGPEFVVRANQPAKQLLVGDVKTASIGRVVVIHLTGQRLEVTCDTQKITAGELFQAIVQAEGLEENFTLGLAALLAGDFVMLPPDTKLNKVAPPGWLNTGKNKGTLGLPTSFMLYLRLRFFLPSLRGIRSWTSKHLLYLQLRRSILEQQLVCPLVQLINLTGLALQAEFGNYSVNEHGCGDYFLLEHYIPESLILNPDQSSLQLPGGPEALRNQLHQSHRDRRGLDANKAEEMFMVHAQTLPDYGAHYYIATIESKELGKIVLQQEKNRDKLYSEPENIYNLEKPSDEPIYGKLEFPKIGSSEDILRIPYTDEQKVRLAKTVNLNEDVYATANKGKHVKLEVNDNNGNNNNNNNSNVDNNRSSKTKKSESNVWLAIHAQGLKLFDRGGRPRERMELARFQWRDVQTLSYSKNCLVVHSRLNGKRCKFKLRMDHRKSYFAFKLTSLHHQFFLKLRSELTSLQGVAAEFGVPLMTEPNSPPPKLKPDNSKTKISIADTVKKHPGSKYPMQLEEYQNKENENPLKESTNVVPKNNRPIHEPICYTPEEDALYAQVHTRLEPEGESRDTEDESDRGQNYSTPESLEKTSNKRNLHGCDKSGLPEENGYCFALPKAKSSKDIDLIVDKIEKPEDIYAAVNKNGVSKRNKFPVPEEVWDVTDVKKALHQVKTSSLPNYGTPKQMGGFRTPSLPRRLGVKMGTRAIYSSLVQRDSALADDLESLSLKSDTTSSIQSASAQSAESAMSEAYVLNADIRTNDETFRIPDDETMSSSLVARLEELSFAEERILHTIRLERGHGGSIGLQVTEGNDGGVYVQAVSVGGSADMAGNVNKGDRIVAINRQSLLNLRYDDALKMLQNSSEMVELVLSQMFSNTNPNSRHSNDHRTIENNYLQNIRFDMASEADTSSMTSKWLAHKLQDVSSVQNTSSAYSSAASSAMGNHNPNTLYLTDVADTNPLSSASMLLSIEDFDLSRTSRQVFI